MSVHRTATRSPLSGFDRVLVGLEITLSVGAYGGSVALMTGTIDLREATADLPFESTFFAGAMLGLINGVLPTVVAIAAIWRRSWASAGHLAVGVALAGWIAVQVAFIGLGSWLQVGYFIYGVVIVALAARLYRRAHA